MVELNKGQKRALDLLMSGQNIFLTGSAGVGKSFTINEFKNSTRKKIGVTSTTGISAILIEGMTIHAWVGIGTGEEPVEDLLRNLKSARGKKARERIQFTDILIIDEISMMPPELFDKLDYLFRAIRYCTLPFGGIQVILVGDFSQLPPVKSNGFVFMAESWPRVIPNENIVQLTQVMRQSDEDFIKALNMVRMADERLLDPENESRRLLDSRVVDPATPVEIEVDGMKMEPTILYSHKSNVEYINENRLKTLLKTEEHHTFDVTVKIKKVEHQVYIDKILDNMQCQRQLQLAVGAQVMLIVNCDFERQLVNGSRGVVKRFIRDPENPTKITGVEVVFRNGEREIFVPHPWEVKKDKDIKITVIQIPLILAYALTIHKSQGSTLDFVTVDLGGCFAPGQVYVALSRARCLDGLYILDIDYEKITTHPAVKEFYKHLSV